VSPTSSEEGSAIHGALIEEQLATPRQQRAKTKASGPAGNRKAHLAADTSTFYVL
jgi:hypothetical protein